jgi:pimeloyl-ACP methyl ester carboxylesterase
MTKLRPAFGHTLMNFVALRPRRRIGHATVAGCPTGDGGPVLVFPGILRDDSQTAALRDGLQMLDYTPHGWGLGNNYGPTRDLMDGAKARLTRLYHESGPVRLIGFSMGGLLARWLAQCRPHMVRQVITVCTPFRDPLHAAWLPVAPFVGIWRHVDTEALAFMVAQTPPMPWAAIYSPIDGVVAPAACVDPAAPEHCVAVRVRHRTAMAEAEVLVAISRCLGAPR